MFTVKIEPRQVEGPPVGYESVPTRHTVYDLKVYDGTGEGDEELLVFSNQGYENRLDARALAVRLFGNRPQPGLLDAAEVVQLVVFDADGREVERMAL